MTGKVDSGVAILSVSAPWCGNDSCLRSWKHANSSRRTCLLFGVHLSYPLFGKPVGNGDQCIAFTFLIWEKWGCLSHGCLPLPFCGGWGCQRWLIDLLASWASSTISRSSSASQDCHTVMRARHQNRKSTVCKQSPPTCAFENLPPPPAPTFCINTNQISPINLLHLISLSTSHPQLKLPYWQMHTHTNNFFFPPLNPPLFKPNKWRELRRGCIRPLCTQSSERFKMGGRSFAPAPLSRCFALREAACGLESGGSCAHLQLPCKAMARICTIAQ